MKDDLKNVERQELQRGSRAPYTVPKLKEFGDVGSLTQGGTGMANEGTQGGGAKPRP